MSRCRNWCYTLFEDEKKVCSDDVITYVCAQKEVCPTSGRIHWQGYMELENPKSISAIKRHLESKTIHLEPRRGTQLQAIAYTKKEDSAVPDTWYEDGTKKSQGKRSDLEEIKSKIDDGASELELWDDHFGSMTRYYKAINHYRDLACEPRNWKTNVIVYWGATGSGKTSRVYQECPDVKPIYYRNGYWQNYNGEDAVLIDDFRPHMMDIAEFLVLTDRYPYTMNVKGGSINFTSRTMYITSNVDPRAWYGGDSAVLRRLDRCTEVTGNTSGHSIYEEKN